MGIWQPAPEEKNAGQNYRIYRTPMGREVELICLSENFLGANLHYWKGRSTPCQKGECEACKSGQKPRWKGYIQAFHAATKTVVIFEFTDRGYDPFQAALQQHEHLRGMRFRTCRLNRKANGPIQIAFSEHREESPTLPKAGDLATMLERIWEVHQQTFQFAAEHGTKSRVPLWVTRGETPENNGIA